MTSLFGFLLAWIYVSITTSTTSTGGVSAFALSGGVGRFARGGTRSVLLHEAGTDSTTAEMTTPPAPMDAVQLYPTAEDVGAAVRQVVRTAARQAVQDRGHFALAIPGGSILKMLVGTGGNDDADWTTHTTLAYVNHKCVAMDDAVQATHAKATSLFLNDWTDCTTILLDGTDNGPAEAASYQTKLQAVSTDSLPRTETGLPVFDLALIGVGDDGHVGSLYPNRDEVLVGSDVSATSDGIPWVLSVDLKTPPSITLSLPVMATANQVVVAACGVSDKYPQGKSAGMQRAIANPKETLTSFPAVGLRARATWMLDEAAASKLGPPYTSTLEKEEEPTEAAES